MKQRFVIGATPVLMRPGWHPDAFTVLNPSDQPMYVREGSADSGVSSGNYDYVVPAGGNLQFPTVADNFSAVQAAAADRPAIVLLWTRNEVAPAFGGGEVAFGANAWGTSVADAPSGTGTGADVIALTADTSRRYVLVQNPTTAAVSFWIRWGTVAAIGSPSIEVAPGVTLTFEGTAIPTNVLHVYAPTGVKYTIVVGD